MKKVILSIYLIITAILIFNAVSAKKAVAMINPWTDCGKNLAKAAQIAGFNFPLKLSEYNVRAMKDMIEITYPADNLGLIEIRKTESDKFGEDISGVYTKYPINKEIKLKNGVPMYIRANRRKIYVMNMTASTGYYSAYCEKGMTKQDLEKIYELLREAEEPKLPPEAYQHIDYSKCELGDLVGDDVKRIKYKGYNIDYHSKDYSKETAKRVAKNCILEGVKTQYEMDCCIRYQMFPETLK